MSTRTSSQLKLEDSLHGSGYLKWILKDIFMNAHLVLLGLMVTWTLLMTSLIGMGKRNQAFQKILSHFFFVFI